MKSTLAALWLIPAILSVGSFPVENYSLDYSLEEESFSVELSKRTHPAAPPPTPAEFHAPPNTCPADRPVFWVNQRSPEVTLDVGSRRQGLSGYFTIVLDPVTHQVRTAGVEFFGDGVHISPSYTVRAHEVPPPRPRGDGAGPFDTFVEVRIRSPAQTTPNGADNGLDYYWRGTEPSFVMRVTQETYRGHRHQSWRIRWDRIYSPAIAVFLVPLAGRRCTTGQRPP